MRNFGIPSRLYRNALEMAGQIVRSQIERKKLFDAIVSGQKVKASPLFAENVKRQIEKAKRKGKPLDYFSPVEPSFSGSVVITSANDGLMGQLKRLSFEKCPNKRTALSGKVGRRQGGHRCSQSCL